MQIYLYTTHTHRFTADTSMAGEESRDSAAMYEARIDIRKFGQFLLGQQFNPTKVICSENASFNSILHACIHYVNYQSMYIYSSCTDIIDGKGLQIFLLHEDVSLQYYIPAVAR